MIPPKPGRRPGSRYWMTVAVGSLGAALAVTLVHASPATPALFVRILARSCIYAIIMGALGGLITPLVAHRATPRRSVRRWALVVGTLLGLAVAGTLVASAIIGAVGLAPNQSFWTRFLDDLRVVALLAVAVGVGMSIFEALHSDLDAATAALHAQRLDEERTRKLALEARLASLEARLHPHFLFNSLNAISALIDEDPARAERMVERLAALLRIALDAGRRGLIPLAEELDLVGDYLEIEKARLGQRLSYAIHADATVEACLVPPLAIQALAENSIKHVIAPRTGGGRLRIGARAADTRVVVEVWDDGPGFTLEAGAPGHGLDTLQGRLSERFGERAALVVGRQDGGTVVTMTLPRSPAALASPA